MTTPAVARFTEKDAKTLRALLLAYRADLSEIIDVDAQPHANHLRAAVDAVQHDLDEGLDVGIWA